MNFPSRAGVADLFRRQLLLSLRHEGANWTLGVLRAAAREKLEESSGMGSSRSQVAAYAEMAGLGSFAAESEALPEAHSEVLPEAQSEAHSCFFAADTVTHTEAQTTESCAARALAGAQVCGSSVVAGPPEVYSVCLEESDGCSDDSGHSDYIRDGL